MLISKRKAQFYFLSFLKHDFKASISVFFVALPLCLGIAQASNAPMYSGLIAGIIGGIVIALISKSSLSVSGPAAGLTTICAAAIANMGGSEKGLPLFFLAVSVAGLLQILLGVFKLGGFTHFIPSTVIRGMLTAIGIILISKQIPLLIGYDKPDFWRNELFNVLTFRHGFGEMSSLYQTISKGAIIIAIFTLVFSIIWKKTLAQKVNFIPTSFITVFFGSLLAWGFFQSHSSFALASSQYIQLPNSVFSELKWPSISSIYSNAEIWRTAVIICFVASLETLLSIEAIDKLDPENRVTPQNRELVAQGIGNLFSGLLGGLPITAVIVRSSANAEAGAKTRTSAFVHGIWLLLAVGFAVQFLNLIPYCVLAVILIRTGYNLAKPSMIISIYQQGRDQFFPFIFTVAAILFTDLLIGVGIGVCYSIYFIIKHNYQAGFSIEEKKQGHNKLLKIELAMNVSYMNKKKLLELLDKVEPYSIVEINGSNSKFIDPDVIEIIQSFKSKAHRKHIQLSLIAIPETTAINTH